MNMTQRRWDDDELLLRDFADAVGEIAPLVDRVAAQGMAAFTWRTVDEELLALSYDSTEGPLATSRAESDGGRVLVFGTAELSVELEVTTDQILGQITPPSAGEVRLETSDGSTVHITADDLGFFVTSPLPGQLVRLRCETSDQRLITEWVRL